MQTSAHVPMCAWTMKSNQTKHSVAVMHTKHNEIVEIKFIYIYLQQQIDSL